MIELSDIYHKTLVSGNNIRIIINVSELSSTGSIFLLFRSAMKRTRVLTCQVKTVIAMSLQLLERNLMSNKLKPELKPFKRTW